MKLGIIGGFGPLATAAFYEKIINMTDAASDQEHIETLIYSKPPIPGRVDYILGKSDINPAPEIRQMALDLEEQNVDLLALPCVTVHYFYDEITLGLCVPLLNMLDETVDFLHRNNFTKVGILGTAGTVLGGHLAKALKSGSIDYILPDKATQDKISSVIFHNVKSGTVSGTDIIQTAGNSLFQQGAEVILLACTELSVLNMKHPFTGSYIDMMDLLAEDAIQKCGKKVRKEMTAYAKLKQALSNAD